ncbi:MAG TPA: hypothetical protein VFK32_06710 [Tepidiformaceae bacterium]|nr:hypothetical protein [Tepidiformaceae bacterium]
MVPEGQADVEAAHGEAVARMTWCSAERAPGVVTGEVGAGKTVAIRVAIASLDPDRHLPIHLGNPDIGLRGIRTAIVIALGGALLAAFAADEAIADDTATRNAVNDVIAAE